MTRNPIIVALDVDSAGEARSLVAKLGGAVNFYKVGLELYAAAGVEFVHELIHSGKDVFLDLKVYDIPETVKRAVAQVARTGVKFLAAHAVNSVMRAAVEGCGDFRLKLLAVTVLAGFGPEDLGEPGNSHSIPDLVALRTRKAMELGMDGIVASPLEAVAVRGIIGPKKVLVTPGVRSAGAAKGDQKRTAVPLEAVRDGADYLVIGRRITRAKDPAREASRIVEEIGAAWIA